MDLGATGADPLNRRRVEDQRPAAGENTAKPLDSLVLEDAGRVIAVWNERQAHHLPMLFAPTVAAALSTRHHFVWVHCRGCRSVRDVDLRMINCDRAAAVTCLTSELSCGSCGPKATFPQELLRLSKTGIADEARKANARRTMK